MGGYLRIQLVGCWEGPGGCLFSSTLGGEYETVVVALRAFFSFFFFPSFLCELTLRNGYCTVRDTGLGWVGFLRCGVV